MGVFKRHVLLVMEIIGEISSDLVVIPGARKSDLRVLDVGNRSFKDHMEALLRSAPVKGSCSSSCRETKAQCSRFRQRVG